MAQDLVTDENSEEKAFPLLTPAQREMMKPYMTRKAFLPQTVISKQDAEGKTMYFIEAGMVRCYTHDLEGKELVVRHLREGDFFGEVSLLTGEKASLTVQTVDEVWAWELNEKHFDTLLRLCPEMTKAIMVEMAHRLRTSGNLLANVKQQIEESRTLTERGIQRLVGQMGTLWFGAVNLVGIAVWVLYNRLAQNPPDSREFSGLGLVVTCEALLVAILVLAKQNREEKDDNIRADYIVQSLKAMTQKLLAEEQKIEAEEKQILEQLRDK